MEKLTEFLAMNGFAAYVWPAYGIAAFILAALIFSTRRAHRHAGRQLSHLQSAARDET